MYCPRCKDDYGDEGHTRCVDCGADLVSGHPQEPEHIKFVQVLSTYNPLDVAMIKSILDSEEITYYFHGENFMLIQPLVEPARLMVDQKEVVTVKELLKDLQLSFTGLNLDKLNKDEDK